MTAFLDFIIFFHDFIGMKVIFFSTKPYDREHFDAAENRAGVEITYVDAHLKPETAGLAEGHDVVCVFVNDKVTAEVMEIFASYGIKLIALRCAGFNNIDLKKAKEKGIKITRVPAYSPEAVAEHALALIMTLNRKTHKAYNRVREMNFSIDRLEGFTVFDKVIGVVGTGKIGSVFCKMMRGFGCKVLAYDIYKQQDLIDRGVNYVELDVLLRQSDVISLHCPLTPETHHMIDWEAVEKMKNHCMLINTSRGALVNTSAVIHALKHRKIGSLALDVYEQEENLFFEDLSEQIIQDDEISRLMSFPNVLITAHQSFFTHEALGQIASVTLQNIHDFENGEPLKNEVKYEEVVG